MVEQQKPLRTVFCEPYSTSDYVDMVCEAIKFMPKDKTNDLVISHKNTTNIFLYIEDDDGRYRINKNTRELQAFKNDGTVANVRLSEIQFTEIINSFTIPIGNLPIIIDIKNASNTTRKVKLFGASKNMLSVNFGNSPDIVVDSGNPHLTYPQILQQTTYCTLNVSYLRFISKGNTAQIQQEITIHSCNFMGKIVPIKITSSASFSPFQQQAGVWDLIHPVKINEFTEIEFDMLPNKSPITIYLYPNTIMQPITN